MGLVVLLLLHIQKLIRERQFLAILLLLGMSLLLLHLLLRLQ
jgi:hypothetical protein